MPQNHGKKYQNFSAWLDSTAGKRESVLLSNMAEPEERDKVVSSLCIPDTDHQSTKFFNFCESTTGCFYDCRSK